MVLANCCVVSRRLQKISLHEGELMINRSSVSIFNLELLDLASGRQTTSFKYLIVNCCFPTRLRDSIFLFSYFLRIDRQLVHKIG